MPQKKRQFKIPINIQGVPVTSIIGLLLFIPVHNNFCQSFIAQNKIYVIYK